MMFYSLKSSAVLAALLLVSTGTVDASTSGVRGAVEEHLSSFPQAAHTKEMVHSPPKTKKHTPRTGELFTPPATKKKHSPPSQQTMIDPFDGHRNLNEYQSRIVGGGNAPQGAYKFNVNFANSCGGSLIAPNLVLTAAHCENVGDGVRIGSNDKSEGGVARGITHKCRHPNYNPANTDNDYLVMALTGPADPAIYAPVALNRDATLPVVDDMLTVIGFGATSQGGAGSQTLLQVQVPANSHAQCRSQYGGVQEDIHLCAGFLEGGKDSCQGDSGGPIFEDRNGVTTQVGVVSFGNGCALPNNSGVYAKVSGAIDWIDATVASLQAGTGCDGNGSGGDSNCMPDPEGWYDSDGPQYNCGWYANGQNCAAHGDSFANFGKTANQACCACGGGIELGTGPTPTAPPVEPPTPSPVTPQTPSPVTPQTPSPVTPQTPSPVTPQTPSPVTPQTPSPVTPQTTPSPVTPQTPSPVTPQTTPSPVAPTGGDQCVSTPNWHDSDGAAFDCAWYGSGTNCADFGDDFPRNGETANQACCECGGGSTGGGGGGGACSDSPSNWHDSDGASFDCNWYARGRRCQRFGDQFPNFGATAQEACCACGGGSN